MPVVELSLMSATPTAVYPNRCLSNRNSETACKYCLEACPNKAIRIDQRMPSLDIDRCWGCGLCLVTCPVECFETENWSETSIPTALDHIGYPAVELVCKAHPRPAVGSEPRPVIQVNTCLGAISPAMWFQIGLKYSAKARLEYCSACPMGKGASYIRQAIQLANQWLQSCGEALFGDQRVTMQENCHDPKESRRRVLISAERPIVSRRDFLFGFARSSGPVELAVKKLPFESANENQENKSGPHIPTWLHRLAQIYPQTGRGLNRANDEHLYSWPTFSVGENCAACQACSVNCPSGALLTKVVDGDYLHLFTPGFCVGCGLCAKVCPAGALSRSYAIDRKPFEQRTISGRRVDPCTKCGQSALHGSGRLCFCCVAEPPVSTVFDSARQFLIHR